ncbi:MAG: hypothetical protein ACR2LR_20595 [Hassallia sp.]
MSMSWQELRKEAYGLSVSDRLALVEAIIRTTHPADHENILN